jgi:hypothetical protein
MVCSVCEQARAEDHEHADAVGGGGEEDRAEQRERRHHDDGEHEAQAGADGRLRPPVARDAGDDHRPRVDDAHVGEGHRGGGEKAPGQVLAPAQGPDDERLQQPGLRVAADRREGEEDGQHRPEEERPEHGQPEQGGARQRARVEAELVAAEPGDVLEELARAPRVEAAEGDGEDHDDREHAPAQRLAQGVGGDDEHAAQVHSAPPPDGLSPGTGSGAGERSGSTTAR